MTVRAILFDKDGTLFDFDATWVPAFETIANELAGGDATLARTLLEAGGYDAGRRAFAAGSIIGAGDTPDVASAWSPLLGDRDVAELTTHLDRLFEVHGIACAHPVTDLRRLFERLRTRGLALGIATNDGQAALRATLERFGLLSSMRFFAGYDSGYGSKPGPGMVHAFCDATGVSPAEVAVVGDNVHDLEMGRRGGVGLTVGVLTGTGRRADLAPHADRIIDSIEDIEALLSER